MHNDMCLFEGQVLHETVEELQFTWCHLQCFRNVQTVVANLLTHTPTSHPAGIVQFRILLTDELNMDTGSRGNEAREELVQAVSCNINIRM